MVFLGVSSILLSLLLGLMIVAGATMATGGATDDASRQLMTREYLLRPGVWVTAAFSAVFVILGIKLIKPISFVPIEEPTHLSSHHRDRPWKPPQDDFPLE